MIQPHIPGGFIPHLPPMLRKSINKPDHLGINQLLGLVDLVASELEVASGQSESKHVRQACSRDVAGGAGMPVLRQHGLGVRGLF